MIAFQVQWFACILGAARGFAWVGLTFGLAWICIHIWALRGERGRELATVGFAFGFGLVAETVLASAGLLQMEGNYRLGTTAGALLVGPPLWLPVLWAGLGATMNHSLGWLAGRYRLATVMGAIAGPFAYASAEHLGAVQIDGMNGLLGVAVAYALATPAMLAVASWATRGTSVLTEEAAR